MKKKRAAKRPKPTKAPALTQLYFDNSASLASGSLPIYLHHEVCVFGEETELQGERGEGRKEGRKGRASPGEAAQVWGGARPYLGVGVQGVGQLAGVVTRCRVAQHGVEGLGGGGGELFRGGPRLDRQEQRQEEDGEAAPPHRHLRSSAPAPAAGSLSRDVPLTELAGRCSSHRGASPPIPWSLAPGGNYRAERAWQRHHLPRAACWKM